MWQQQRRLRLNGWYDNRFSHTPRGARPKGVETVNCVLCTIISGILARNLDLLLIPTMCKCATRDSHICTWSEEERDGEELKSVMEGEREMYLSYACGYFNLYIEMFGTTTTVAAPPLESRR